MIACTKIASQREAWQTRSGLKRTTAKRAAQGFGVPPTSGREPFSQRENGRTAFFYIQCVYAKTSLAKIVYM
jgi:hypothetical protein